jgi:DNA-binding IclR family transcriptional regulator
MPAQATVPILHKAACVLRALAEGESIGSIQQLARSAEIPTTTCFRIVNTYEQEGWVAKPDGFGRGYRLSHGLLGLLAPLRDYERLFARALPRLRRLADDTGLCAKLSIRDGLEAVTVERAEPSDGLSLTSAIGARFPVVIGSSGAALLHRLEEAELKRIIEQSPASAWEHQSEGDLRRRIEECRATGLCHDAGSYRPGVAGVSSFITHEGIDAAVTLTGLSRDVESIERTQLDRLLHEAIAGLRRGLDETPAGASKR